MKKNKHDHHGGERRNSGRPFKKDPENWGQITCVLRTDTIEALRAGAGSKRFGPYLQFHLDRTHLLTHDEYEAVTKGKPLFTEIRRRRVPVIITASEPVRKPRRRTEKEIEEELAEAIK